jgi:SnoaL-like domain
MTTHSELIDTYFVRAAGPDLDAYLQLFAANAVVEDEGHQYRGIETIRAWRGSTVPVRYEVLDASAAAGTGLTTTRVRISGEFPGSPVVLVFRFVFDTNGRITELTIRPATTS